MELPESHAWSDRPTAETLAKIPGVAAVYLLCDASGAPVQFATTQHLRRALLGRLADADRPAQGKADLGAIVRAVHWRTICHPFEARWWHYRLARLLHPDSYRDQLAFGSAWFLQFDESRAAPEIRVSDQIWRRSGDFVGPWPSQRAAQEALDILRDLFELCRYPEELRRAPLGQRCAYADMGRCDAPCDGAAPLSAYAARAAHAWRFAGGAIEPWLAEATRRMQSAAAEQRYEQAALLKHQREAAQRWRTIWGSRIRPADQMSWLLILPVTRRRAWKVLCFDRGKLADGPILTAKRLAEAATWLQSAAAAQPDEDQLVRMEQTWLTSHFLYSRAAEDACIIDTSGVAPSEVESRLAEWAAQAARRPPAPVPPESDASSPGSPPPDDDSPLAPAG